MIVVCIRAIEERLAVDIAIAHNGILHIDAQEVKHLVYVPSHVPNEKHLLKHVGILTQVGNVTSELGKRVTEEFTVQVDDQRSDSL